jgi:predicted nucleic acid-binding protein
MAASLIVDASFLVPLLSDSDTHHLWAANQSLLFPPPWKTCEAAISETFHLVGPRGASSLTELLRSRAVLSAFHFGESTDEVMRLLVKYADVPMSFADACLVRMTETMPDPLVLTADTDFRIYRRHGRQTVPCVMPS